jgi:hypothetical protein
MPRRHRTEFQALESQLEYGVAEKAWRDLFDKILYSKGPGPKPIREQLRLRERLQRLHARRDRYNQKRYGQHYQALIRKLEPRHIIAGLAIGIGIAEPSEGPLPRDLLIGAMAGDNRLTKKFFEELETVYETLFPSFHPRESHPFWMKYSKDLEAVAREERKPFLNTLAPTPVAVQATPNIPFGFRLTEPSKTNATPAQAYPQTARKAS